MQGGKYNSNKPHNNRNNQVQPRRQPQPHLQRQMDKAVSPGAAIDDFDVSGAAGASTTRLSVISSPLIFLHRHPWLCLILCITGALIFYLTTLIGVDVRTLTNADKHKPSPLSSAAAFTPASSVPSLPTRSKAATAAVITVSSPLNTYPHDSQCFTQGLEWWDGQLYESCGMYGYSSIRKVDVTTGRVIASTSLDKKYFAEGITIVDSRIYQLTWREQRCFVYDLRLQKIQELSYTGDGWGITHTDNHLVISDGSSTLKFYHIPALQHTELALSHSITATKSPTQSPITNLNELEFIQGYIYANIWMQPKIVKIDPSTGHVSTIYDLGPIQLLAKGNNQDKVVNGIAYRIDTKQLYVTGKYWDKLFEVENMTDAESDGG